MFAGRAVLHRQGAAAPREANRRPIHQMVEGLRYVVRNKMVLGAITLDLFAVFLAGATALSRSTPATSWR